MNEPLAITFPLSDFQELLSICNRLGYQALYPDQRKALALAEQEVLKLRRAANMTGVAENGAVAFLEGASIEDNPFHQTETRKWREWNNSYSDRARRG